MTPVVVAVYASADQFATRVRNGTLSYQQLLAALMLAARPSPRGSGLPLAKAGYVVRGLVILLGYG